jgi:chromosome segregation ATPase
MIARTISIALVAKDFSSSRATLEAILARHHGYAASLTANTQQNAARSLQASLRIPAPELGAALAELKSLGQVQNETQGGEEVTQQHADLVARLKNSRETERRLQAILEQRTGKITDVLAVEQEIARVRGEIEQMEAEQKSLEHRVDFATVDLSVLEEYKAQIGSPSPSFSTRLHNALVGGYRDALETLAGIVLFFAADGPSIFLWLAFLLPVMWLLRRRWLREHAAVSPAGV